MLLFVIISDYVSKVLKIQVISIKRSGLMSASIILIMLRDNVADGHVHVAVDFGVEELLDFG